MKIRSISAKSIQELISEKYPGINLESQIQGWVYLENFDQGIQEYTNLSAPTAEDDRWVGVCYFQKLQDMKAVEMYYRAIARGAEPARINLAHTFGFIERGDEVLVELEQVDFSKLNTYDQVFFLRVKSLHEEVNGEVLEALKDAEGAWRLVQGIPEFPILAPKILNQLGILFGRIGKAQRALWYLNRSLEMTRGLERLRVLIVRASVFISLGRYSEALEELSIPGLSNIPDQFQALKHCWEGEAYWALGNLTKAINYFENAIDKAIETQQIYEEFLSRTSLSTILASRSKFHLASENLARAQLLITDKADRYAFRFREILIENWRGSYSSEHALAELKILASDFQTMGLLQEQGWVRLHIAEMYRRLGDERYLTELDALQALSVTLQNRAFLAREWTLVPELQKIARKTHPKIAGDAPTVLEVYTLGQERLVLDGKPVKIPLREGIEILAYFLEYEAMSLKKLILEVFPDKKPRSAKSYFHQFRHQLHEHIPGLEIAYERESRLYRLKSEIDILWDVAELRAGRKMGDLGLFLPRSGNDWAQILEHGLEPYRDDDVAVLDV